MEIAIKITLIASLILVGYSLSQLLTSYDAVCEKVKRFKELAVETESKDSEIKMSNTFLTGVLSVIFVVLLYLSGLAYWIVAVVAAKMVITCVLSNKELNLILANDSVDQKFFRVTKVDSVVNILTGLAVAVFLVA